MIENANAIPRISLGVIIDATRLPVPGVATSLAAADNLPSETGLLPATDERFALQVVTVADIASMDGAAMLAAHPHWCGVLLDDALHRSARGAGADAVAETGWAAALKIDDALMPLEFVEHLREEQAADSFVARVLTCRAWRELRDTGITLAKLQTFFAQHKYLLMSRHIGSYQQLGQLLAASAPTLTAQALDDLARQAITAIMAALRRPATRGGHGNALAHIRGYLKNRLSGAEKSALDEALEWYRLGLVPLHTPLGLLRDYFARYPHAYIDQQVYMQSHLHARLDLATLLAPLRGEGERWQSAGER